jgi:hypothetical protein
MSMAVDSIVEGFSDSILPLQYNDLIRRPSPILDGEYRLMWAVLEDAIRTYLTSRKRSTREQKQAFDEVRRWFQRSQPEARGLFDFQTICEILGIDSACLLQTLESAAQREFTPRLRRIHYRRANRKLAA